MLLKQFTIAHCFPVGSKLSASVHNLRSKCKEICSEAKEPKLGDHVTLLPPFRAHVDEMRQFAMGLKIAQAYYDVGGKQVYGEAAGVNFFRNSGSDAFFVNIHLPSGYHAMIEECREQLSRFNEWVFPLLGDAYKPHLCVVEGRGVFDELEPHLYLLHPLIPSMSFHLPFFKIMEKVTESGVSRWEEFDPQKD